MYKNFSFDDNILNSYLLLETNDWSINYINQVNVSFDRVEIAKSTKLIEVELNFTKNNSATKKRFEALEIDYLYKFSDYIKTMDIVDDLIISSLKQDYISIKNPLAEGYITSAHNIFCNGVNFIRFCHNTEIFYLVQHDLVAEALFFPFRGMAIGFGDFNSPFGKLNRLITELLLNQREYSSYFSDTCSWDGVYIGSTSPYHFFYFDIPSLYYMVTSIGVVPPTIYTMDNELYFDPSHFITSSRVNSYKKPNLINNKLINDKKFFFLIGQKMEFWFDSLHIKELDSQILSSAKKNSSYSCNNLINSSYPTIWLGISAGKRVWLEELDSFIEFIQGIYTKCSGVNLIIDGWTNVESCISNPGEYSIDSLRANELINNIPNEINVINLIGESAINKITIASLCDFFIASHGTASLFVSRICGVPGVTHISNIARDSAISVHHHQNSYLVPKSFVSDSFDENYTNAYSVNYNIEKTNFLNFIKDCFFKSYLSAT